MMRMKMTSFKTIGQGIVHGKNFDSREFLSYSINLLELLELDEEEDDDDEDEELKTNEQTMSILIQFTLPARTTGA